MEEIGVQAVVKGLTSFLSDLGKIKSGLTGLQNALPKGNLFTDIFAGGANALKSLGREVLNVAEYALGHILADAVQWVTQKISELAQATVESGSQFQLMELRLNRLNLNTLIQQTGDFTTAQKLAKEATQDQLQWVLKLAATTPYDAQDIANVYTLARSYGFVGEQAKGLTKDISDFAAGMGLGNTEIERIIVNFGQMVQQGKVTQREMNDLARGAFVPVNDVLKRMQENVGLTDKEFAKFRQTGEGVKAFMTAFSQIVSERFAGAAEDMARTFQGATANAQDFIKSIVGFNVVKPILDTIGGKVANLLTALTAPGTFEAVSLSASRFGNALKGLVSDLLGLGKVDTTSIVQGILQGLNRMTGWLNENKGKIIDFFEGIGTTISSKVIPFIMKIANAFDTISAWVGTNGALISSFFSTLGEIIAAVFSDLSGGKIQIGGGLEGFLSGVTSFMQYVIANKDGIAEFISDLTRLFVIVQAITFVMGVLGGIFLSVITFVIGLGASIAGLIGMFSVLSTILPVIGAALVALASFFAPIIGIAAAVAAAIVLMRFVFFATVDGIRTGVSMIVAQWKLLISIAVDTANKMITAFKTGNWSGIGSAIIQGIGAGLKAGASFLVSIIQAVVANAVSAAKKALGIASPSKIFADIGENTMKGMAQGIQSMAGLVEGVMQGAMAQATLPALAMPAVVQNYAMAASSVPSATYNTTNNMNLTINSAARTEQVMQDYNTMRAMIGA